MTAHEASRTLVKSPPELWAECSNAASLARHLGEFGEITITRLDPETAVAWEGERASGTVRIEPSAWGTRVTLTAQMPEVETLMPAIETRAALEAQVPADESEPYEEVVDETVVDEATVEPVVVEAVEEAGPPAVDEQEPPAPPTVAKRRGLIARLKWWFSPPDEQALAAQPGPAEPGPEQTETGEPRPAEPVPGISDPAPEPIAEAPPPEPAASPEPEPVAPEPTPEPVAPALPPFDATEILAAALDSLGQAHHRPYSRA